MTPYHDVRKKELQIKLSQNSICYMLRCINTFRVNIKKNKITLIKEWEIKTGAFPNSFP